jgi:hypothetical protein
MLNGLDGSPRLDRVSFGTTSNEPSRRSARHTEEIAKTVLRCNPVEAPEGCTSRVGTSVTAKLERH